MRLLCDEMLRRLGRWLRAAGYDTLIAPDGTPDRELLAQARREHRLLLTRDLKLREHRHADDTVVVLDCNATEDCAREAAARLGIDWLHAPFTRCLQCNTPVVPATAEERLRVPADSRGHHEPVLYCPECDQVFWPGSHVRRMRRVLERWAEGEY
jgi:uncharacterized protein with PIN domain